MRVAVYHANDDVRVEDQDEPGIAADEVLVRVDACGVCGSDVMEWYRKPKAPVVLGHEIAATIEEVGADVEGWAVGDRVAVSHHVPCLRCRRCRRGEETLCDLIRATDLEPGGFAERARVPAVNVAHGLFALPDAVPPEAGVLVEPLGCVVRGQRNLPLRPDDTAVVLGAGITGLLHLQLLRHAGVERVFCTDPVPARRAAAARLGAQGAFDPTADVANFVEKQSDGRLADVVVVCTGAPAAIHQAMELVEPGGTVLWFAPTHPDAEGELRLPFNRLWREGVTQVSSYGAAPRDMEEARDLLAKGAVDWAPLVTHRLPLEEVQAAFDLVAEGREGLKVVVEP